MHAPAPTTAHRPTAFEARRPRHAPFSPLRSVGLAGVLALHVAAAGTLFVPIAAPPAEAPSSPAPSVTWVPITVPPVPPAPPEPPRPRPAASPAPTPPVGRAPAPDPTPAAPALPTAAPSRLDPPGAGIAGPAVPAPTGADLGAEGLRLRVGPPPRYPREALRRGFEGEVVLVVLIGPDGRPQAVTVARSSGHAVLDRMAREHVAARWAFEPPMRGGVPVAATVRVPVRFTLPR